MQKVCENCRNFTQFYVKVGGYYFHTACGRCWANKHITGHQNTCGKWEAKPEGDNTEEELLKAFDTEIITYEIKK